MSLRSDAVAAYQASEADKTAEARAALGVVLSPFDPKGLTVADVVTNGFTLFVFTDKDVFLAVRSADTGWAVFLVADDAGWTVLATITSLAQLGKVLPKAPASAPAWVQPTGAGDAYPMGALVTHNGKTWESLNDANVWEPPTQWREIV